MIGRVVNNHGLLVNIHVAMIHNNVGPKVPMVKSNEVKNVPFGANENATRVVGGRKFQSNLPSPATAESSLEEKELLKVSTRPIRSILSPLTTSLSGPGAPERQNPSCSRTRLSLKG